MTKAGKRPACDCCGQIKRCSKFIKIPIGPDNKREIVKVCGFCVYRRGSQLRSWLDKKENELREN